MLQTVIAKKVQELEAWAAAEGLPLPKSAAVIARLELAGYTVDLLTGDIVLRGAQDRYRPTAGGVAAVDEEVGHAEL